MASEHKRLGDLLLESGLVTTEQLDQAVAEQKKSGRQLGMTLVQLGFVGEMDLVQLLQRQLGLPLVDLEQTPVDERAIGLIKEEQAKKYTALPVEIEGRKTLVVAMADPLNVHAIEDLRFHSGLFIKPVLAPPSQILEAIERHYHLDTKVNEVIQSIIENEDEVVVSAVTENDERQALDELMREAEGRPIVRLTNWLLHRAVEERASDIHIEPQLNELIVRFRVDGLLREEQRLPRWTQGAVVSRIKVLANLDIAEKRLPQDGRLVAEIQGRRVDMRVSTLPITAGEKVVMRVVDQSRARVDLNSLGMEERDLDRLKRFLDRPQGIVLVTGPTGSGKSTLLYSALRHVQSVTRNITTVEDPVEYQLAGINQVQVDEKAKKTFPAVLRSILRQDPDVIFVGEIRDEETARTAMQAAMTGHLVLSTVHAKDTISAVFRLLDLKIEPYLVANSMDLILAQRLVRVLCEGCKSAVPVSPAQATRVGRFLGGKSTVFAATGCSRCLRTGYRGRRALFELLDFTDELRDVILREPTIQAMRRVIEQGLFTTLAQSGWKMVADGFTTFEEVDAVTGG